MQKAFKEKFLSAAPSLLPSPGRLWGRKEAWERSCGGEVEEQGGWLLEGWGGGALQPLQSSVLGLPACVQQNMKEDRRQKDRKTGPAAALLRFIPSALRATVPCQDETHSGWWNRHTFKKKTSNITRGAAESWQKSIIMEGKRGSRSLLTRCY